MQSYAELLSHWKKIEVIRSTSALLNWDMETYMPVGSIDLRQEQLSLAAQLEHTWMNDPKFKDAVLSGRITPSNDREKRNLELWRKGILVSSSVDAKFVDEFTRITSECNVKWRAAREKSLFAEVKEPLKRVVAINREFLQRIKSNPGLKDYYANKSLYEVAFDQYEPGMNLKDMETMLRKLCEGTKERLPRYIAKSEEQSRKTSKAPNGAKVNKSFCESIMKAVGFNFNRGRLDTSTHPFNGGYAGDVRMTVRSKPVDPIEDLYSTLHEVGHALYEQGLPEETLYEPCGKHCSMGVHESQSRFVENIIGRSKAFAEALAPQLDTDAQSLYASVSPVKLGYIRVDSDEVTYNLHILFRYEIERDLIEGRLETDDLPERWNTSFHELTGLRVEKDSQGCLQDTHWYTGLFGYFPTYSLGNMLAAELFQDFRAKHPDWASRVANADLSFVREFMAERVYPLASKYDSPECMEKIIGRKVSEKALLTYFDEKFG